MTKSFILALLMTYPTCAEISSGSIVIFNFTKDEIVVAANSLATHHDTGTPDYSYCKIATLGHQLIFTSVGRAMATLPGRVLWDNTALAGEAFRSAKKGVRGEVDLNDVVDLWARSVKSHWVTIDWARIADLSRTNNGQLTAGVFIGKGLAYKVVALSYNGVLDPAKYTVANTIDGCWPCGQLNGGMVCGAGHHLDVAAKFCSERRHGDKIIVRTRLKGASEGAKLAIKIVEIT